MAQTVRTYIDQRPVIKDAMHMGIVNLSALTRRIMDETPLNQEEAVLVACRRYDGAPALVGYEAGIRKVLDRSKLEVRTRIAVWTLRRSWKLMSRLEKVLPRIQGESSPVHILHGSEAVTLIADEAIEPALLEAMEPDDVLRTRTGVVEVNLRTPEHIHDVPGILAFVSSSLASRGINFVEVISCHKDNMFVIDDADMFAAFEVLNSLIRA